jgi:hypothetical protein
MERALMKFMRVVWSPVLKILFVYMTYEMEMSLI